VSCPSGSANVFNSGIFDIAPPAPGTTFQPAKRIRRDKFGVFGPFKLSNGLTEKDLDNLVYPDATEAEKDALVEGLKFFTMFHTPGEGGLLPDDNGVGPLNNQPACIGCHLNAAEAVNSRGLLQGPNCDSKLNCKNVSNVTRAGRSTPTNFEFTSLDPATGGGRAPDKNLTELMNTGGKTAAFTNFGDFSPVLLDTAPGSIGFFDPLDGANHTSTTSSFTSQPFGGFVQHVRPALPPDVCVPKPLPPVAFDANLTGSNLNQYRRSVGERAGPAYIGRGLMEAVPTNDILYFAANATDFGATADPQRANGKASSLAKLLGCTINGPTPTTAFCINGNVNKIPRNFAVNTITAPPAPVAGTTATGVVGGVGRFGLRANGVEMLQFIVGGLQGELSFTNLLNPAEINFPELFQTGVTPFPQNEPMACMNARSETPGQPVNIATLEVHLSTPFSIRNLLRNTAPPEFGDALLDVLQSPDPSKPRHGNSNRDRDAAQVQRGAELFGIDLVAFAHRTIGRAMTAGGDGRDDNAINQTDRQLNCVGCHTPIRKTGTSPAPPGVSPAGVGGEHLSNVWAPIFSDLLLHHMPVIDAERATTNGLPRDVVSISRLATKVSNKGDDGGEDEGRDDDRGHRKGRVFDTFDLPRNLADDTFSNAKGSAEGSEFRTPPLMGFGRIGAPFLHDARVYLSKDTVKSTPAGTVTTNSEQTNASLVVRSLDDAILAAIELHDLPAPDDKKTPKTPGAGCPVPTETINVTETVADICPAYSSATSQTNRSDAREVIRRFRELSSDDQQAVIEFLKQL
jgi:hypothetical protein